MCVYKYGCMYSCMHIYVHIYTYSCKRMHMIICACMYIHTCTFTFTYTCAYICYFLNWTHSQYSCTHVHTQTYHSLDLVERFHFRLRWSRMTRSSAKSCNVSFQFVDFALLLRCIAVCYLCCSVRMTRSGAKSRNVSVNFALLLQCIVVCCRVL